MLFKYRQSVDAIHIADNPTEIVEFVKKHQIPADTNGPNSWVLRVPGHNQVAHRGDWIIAGQRGNSRNVMVMDNPAFEATFQAEEAAERLTLEIQGRAIDSRQLEDWLTTNRPYMEHVDPDNLGHETPTEMAIRFMSQLLPAAQNAVAPKLSETENV